MENSTSIRLEKGQVLGIDLEFHSAYRRTTLFELFARGCALYNEAITGTNPLLIPGFLGESSELFIKAMLVASRRRYPRTHSFDALTKELDPRLLELLVDTIGSKQWQSATRMLDVFINAPQRRYGASGSTDHLGHVSVYSDSPSTWKEKIGDFVPLVRDLVGTMIWRNFPCKFSDVEIRAIPIYAKGFDPDKHFWYRKDKRRVYGFSLSMADPNDGSLSRLWSLIPMDREGDGNVNVTLLSDSGEIEVTVELEYEQHALRTPFGRVTLSRVPNGRLSHELQLVLHELWARCSVDDGLTYLAPTRGGLMVTPSLPEGGVVQTKTVTLKSRESHVDDSGH